METIRMKGHGKGQGPAWNLEEQDNTAIDEEKSLGMLEHRCSEGHGSWRMLANVEQHPMPIEASRSSKPNGNDNDSEGFAVAKSKKDMRESQKTSKITSNSIETGPTQLHPA